jgi:hypothetical protein
MNYATAQSLSARKFKRRFGVHKQTFKRMQLAFNQQVSKTTTAGRPWQLSRENQILAALEYWREYRTYFHIATEFGVSESTVCRAVHRVEKVLMASGLFRLPGKKHLIKGFGRPSVIVMDDNSYTPRKKPKTRELSPLEKEYNRDLAKERIGIEPVNRRLAHF